KPELIHDIESDHQANATVLPVARASPDVVFVINGGSRFPVILETVLRLAVDDVGLHGKLLPYTQVKSVACGVKPVLQVGEFKLAEIFSIERIGFKDVRERKSQTKSAKSIHYAEVAIGVIIVIG